MQEIYLDYASATPIHKDVVQAMKPYFSEQFWNASAMHGKGQAAAKNVSSCKERILTKLNAKNHDIMFCSGATESIVIAFHSIAATRKKSHIITCATEHKSILNACTQLQNLGHEVTMLPVDSQGHILISDLIANIRDNTVLASFSFVNNETGSIQNMAEIVAECHKRGVLVHTDASQIKTPTDIAGIGLDLVTLNSAKMYGPKGIGALIHNQPEHIPSRLGTLNTPGIAGFSKAVELLDLKRKEHATLLREAFLKELGESGILLDVGENYHPWIINVSFEGAQSEHLVKHASAQGLFISPGSACTSGDLNPSHVLTAMGLSMPRALSSIRISTSYLNTEAEMREAAKRLKSIATELQSAKSVSAKSVQKGVKFS